MTHGLAARAAVALAPLLALVGCENPMGLRVTIVDAATEDRAPPRWALCLERRVDLSNDPLHCGACETSCRATQVCRDGFCVQGPTCPSPFASCDGRCVNPASDALHCGACGNACPPGASCTSSRCVCGGAGLTLCSGACVDLRTNPEHCGVCGRRCEGACNAGQCACAPPRSLCAGVCVDTMTSAQHCGRCNSACVQGACVGGVCTCADARLTSCGGQCVDTRVRFEHCGGCSRGCAPTADCVDAACVGRPWWPPFGARVGSRTPTLRWLSDGMGVELCADRACARVVQRFEPTALQRVTTARLERGAWWWRLYNAATTARGAPSLFYVDARDAAVDGVLPPVHDLNGDGLADLVVFSARPAVAAVYYGAQGGVATAASWRVQSSVYAENAVIRAPGDLNGDGYGDLLVAPTGQSSGVVDGAASIGSPTFRSPMLPTGLVPALDLTRDGFSDWVMVNGSSLQLALGARTSGVGSLTAIAHPALAISVGAVALLGDVDGDAMPDVAAGAPAVQPPRVYVYHGSASGPMRATLLAPPPIRTGYGAIVRAAGDVNGDGFADVLAGLGTAGAVLHHGGREGLTLAATITAAAVSLDVFAAGDVDGDGDGDLLALAADREEAWLYRGGPEGLAARPEVFEGVYWRGAEVVSAPGDLDGDGFDDIAVGVPSRDRVHVLYGGAMPFARATTLLGTSGTEFGRALP